MEAIKTAWDFFQNEILGMHWLNRLISTVLNACGLDTTTRIGGSVQFFIYDNRLVNDKCSLQSFGDAQGNRFDFYRFFRLLEQGNLEPKFQKVEELLRKVLGRADKEVLLAEALLLVQSGHCSSDAMRLMECFGYAENGMISVPIYKPEHQKYILEIESVVEDCIGEAVVQALFDLAVSIDITAVKHGVNCLETANELYHIVFGSINEELVSRGMVAQPQYIPGEGRYFKCIEVY